MAYDTSTITILLTPTKVFLVRASKKKPSKRRSLSIIRGTQRDTFKQNTLNVVFCIPTSFFAIFDYDLFGCFS